MEVYDNYLHNGVQLDELGQMFLDLEKYVAYDLESRRDPSGKYEELFRWTSGEEALDFSVYVAWESQTLAKMARALGLGDRDECWNGVCRARPFFTVVYIFF